MALNSLICADVPLRNCSLTHAYLRRYGMTVSVCHLLRDTWRHCCFSRAAVHCSCYFCASCINGNSSSNSSICSAPPTISPMAHSIVSGRSVLSWTGMSLGDAWMLLAMTAWVSVPSATDSTHGARRQVYNVYTCINTLTYLLTN